MATVGAAVGLGNIWLFPYLVGENGGSAFVMLYLAFVSLIGMPLLLGEMMLGRLARCNQIDAMTKLSQQFNASKKWVWLGWWGSAILLLILSFYSVVSGWSLAYIYKSLNGLFTNADSQQVHNIWQNFINSPEEMLLYHGLFLGLTIWIVMRGVKSGLEKASNVMMPSLFIILIALAVYAYGLPGFELAFAYLFKFNWQAITASSVIAALGQACFSLAIGAGCMLVYGSYVSHKENLVNAVFIIALLNILVALLAGLAIFPVVFSQFAEASGGPNLMFVTLPIIFAKITYGKWLGAAFFVLLMFAGLTSAISFVEPLAIILVDKLHIKRTTACLLVGIAAYILGIGSALSFNVWQNITFYDYNFFTIITTITSKIMLPIGVLGFALFIGWCVNRRKSETTLNIKSAALFTTWYRLVKWLAPVAIAAVLLMGII
jgi:NSS family neurotransmitter:Na+ symporter